MKRQILESRIRIFEDVNEFLKFHLKGKVNPPRSSQNALQKELKEKNELLQQVGDRVNTIFFKLSGKNSGGNKQILIVPDEYESYIAEIEEITAEALEAYNEGRYQDYLWRVQTRIERMVRLLYIKTHQLQIDEEFKVDVLGMVSDIGKTAGVWFRTLDQFRQYKELRHSVVHKYKKPTKQEVDEAKVIYDAFFEELKEVYSSL
jgi:hypothetical protein